MINISDRLKTVASFVLKEKSNKIIDVGCDHALLDIYLLERDDSLNLVASDNKKAPLENAKKNIEKYSFLNKIELSLKNGIENIDDDIDTVVIAGMGMETIVEILNNGKKELKHVNRLIISSNNKYEDLRKKIISLGFFISDERIVCEEEKYYIVVEFKKGSQKYTNEELYFGPILLENINELFNDYYRKIRKEKTYILDNLPKDSLKRESLLKEIELLNRYIK